MLSSIKGKFIIISVTFILFAVGIPLLFLVQQFRENFHQRSQIMLESTLDMLSNGLDNVMMLGNEKKVKHIIRRISETQSVDHIRLFDSEGIITHSSDSNEVGESILQLAFDHIPENFDTISKRHISMLDDVHTHVAFQPIMNKEECRGCHNEENVISYMDVDTHLTRAEVQFYTGSFHLIFLGMAVIIILCAGLLLLFNIYINEPMQVFSKALDKVEEGDLKTRLKVVRNDEFGKLNARFNSMVSKLQSYREKISRMHQEELIHSDKLATIGELTSQMAHEINNHSAIALMRSDYLQLESEKKMELSNFKSDLEVIKNEIERVSAITQNVLRHSKKRKISFIDVNLCDVIKQSAEMLQPAFKQKKIDLKSECRCNGKKVKGDSSLLEQVAINLMINAFDSIKDRGEIQVMCFSENDKVELSIRDNGCGMSEETKQSIFSPFFTTKEYDKGTGLGLYIVKAICNQHDADITCESEIDKGTIFTITFNSSEMNNV